MISLGIIAATQRLGPVSPYVTSLDGSGERDGTLVSYLGTYLPAGLSPAPTLYVDVLDGSTVIASEVADTVGAGLFNGTITAATGNTLRVEAISGATKTSTSGPIGTTVTMELP
jgi:hypothetical protein